MKSDQKGEISEAAKTEVVNNRGEGVKEAPSDSPKNSGCALRSVIAMPLL